MVISKTATIVTASFVFDLMEKNKKSIEVSSICILAGIVLSILESAFYLS